MVVNGDTRTVEGSHSVAIVKLTGHHAEVLFEFGVPNSVFRPPDTIDTTPDGRLALVTARAHRTDPTKTAWDDLPDVVDLTEKPPRVIDTLYAGPGVGGISISPDGATPIAASRSDGSITALSTKGTKSFRLRRSCSARTRVWAMSRSGHRVTIHAGEVEVTKRDLFPGQRRNGIDVSSKGDFDVVSNIGKVQSDIGTVSLVDLTVEPPEVVDTVSVGQTPEGVAISPDGKFGGVTE